MARRVDEGVYLCAKGVGSAWAGVAPSGHGGREGGGLSAKGSWMEWEASCFEAALARRLSMEIAGMSP